MEGRKRKRERKGERGRGRGGGGGRGAREEEGDGKLRGTKEKMKGLEEEEESGELVRRMTWIVVRREREPNLRFP